MGIEVKVEDIQTKLFEEGIHKLSIEKDRTFIGRKEYLKVSAYAVGKTDIEVSSIVQGVLREMVGMGTVKIEPTKDGGVNMEYYPLAKVEIQDQIVQEVYRRPCPTPGAR